jgi:hypothetical protein
MLITYVYILQFQTDNGIPGHFPWSVNRWHIVWTEVRRLSVCWRRKKRKLSVCKWTKRTKRSCLSLASPYPRFGRLGHPPNWSVCRWCPIIGRVSLLQTGFLLLDGSLLWQLGPYGKCGSDHICTWCEIPWLQRERGLIVTVLDVAVGVSQCLNGGWTHNQGKV